MGSEADLLGKYFPLLGDDKVALLLEFKELFIDWNAKVNMVSRKDTDHLLERHILHSLAIAKVMEFKKGSRVLDIGTGGGFPGLPLAILYPDSEFTLVDSIGKKIMVVQDICEKLNIRNVTAIHQRAEKVKGKFDFVISRAVTRMNRFLPWTRGKFESKSINDLPNGILYLKGGDLSEELAETGRDYKLFSISDFYDEEFFETKKVVYISMK